jgi:Zn-dependent metalloprotease
VRRSPHAVCGIVPPYILEALASHGDAVVRDAASRTLAVTVDLGERRLAATPGTTALGVTAPREHRSVHDANHTEDLPGMLVRDEGAPPTGDVAVDEAFDGLGDTWTLYQEVYGRNSIDDHGLALVGSVHFGQQYDNAYWDGQQMVFGDGDGVLFNRFTIAVDVIGHELTHGVTGATANLSYQGQSGALNESISDVFGSIVKQYTLNQTAEQADWLIGAGLLAADIDGVALRSMKAPGTAYDDPQLGGKDPQPATMAGYVHTASDNGGVHTNSGIPNHAFALAALALGGNSWDEAGHIWYAALTGGRLRTSATFKEFASVTAQTAGELYGSTQQQAVREAWLQVGVEVA